MIQVEKGIPIPEVGKGKYPFEAMEEEGDSFFVPVDEEKTKGGEEERKKALSNLKGSVVGAKRRYCDKFKTGEEPEFLVAIVERANGGKEGVRCWLTRKPRISVPISLDERKTQEKEKEENEATE